MVASQSNKKRLWRCVNDHNWEATPNNRTPPARSGCPFCSGREPIQGVTDLATLYPEVAKEADGWDPSSVSSKSGKKMPWRCSKGHTWITRVAERTFGSSGCPCCSGTVVITGETDLATLYPEVAREASGWDPSLIAPKSNKKLSWCCPKNHIYEAVVAARTPPRSTGCPICSGNKVLSGFNDLATIFPELAKEADGWNPSTRTFGSKQKMPWRCSMGHRWEAIIINRKPPLGRGCPICGGKQVLAGFNDLATRYPNLARQADGWDPKTVTCGCSNKLSWRCTKGHSWKATVASRAKPDGRGCPICSGKQVLVGFNDLATLFPQLAEEAYGWDPTTVTAGSDKKVSWKCKEGHVWKTVVDQRTPPRSSDCPECAEFGFKQTLPAWFYLLQRPGEQQLGITNYKEDRISAHSRLGWFEVEIAGPYPGEQVFATEKKFKKWLRKEVGLVPGTHENWFTARLEVNSLAELKAVSGVETDLF